VSLGPGSYHMVSLDCHKTGRSLKLSCHGRFLKIKIKTGRINIVMDDGAEEEFGPGDAAVIPPGHNAWVVGNEPVVGIDFTGLKEYAKS
jgi:hypothetical protein